MIASNAIYVLHDDSLNKRLDKLNAQILFDGFYFCYT